MRSAYRLLLFALGAVVAQPCDLLAYADKTTHARLTDGSFRLIPNDATEIHAYRCEVSLGSVSEDEEPRYLYHFWNPVTGRGLPRNSYTMAFSAIMGIATTGQPGPGLEPSPSYRTAMDWGWDEMPDDYDWLGAIDAYGENDRLEAYTGLGHVLHLLQDLGQPDHADSRPHPGNYVAQYIPSITKVGYEGLWGQPNIFWPPGASIEHKPSLQGFFRSIADLARAEELPVKARWTDEVALGLGTLKHESLGRAIVAVGEAAGFVDNNWKKFELKAAVWPLIPLQQNDPRFQDHLALGFRLLPRIEQLGSGLLMHFYDIVNPPPFVEGVEISQNGVTKVLKGWAGERGHTRVFREDTDEPLERDVPATVTIRIGPRHPSPLFAGPTEAGSSPCSSADSQAQVREKLRTITVTIRSDSGSNGLAVIEGSEPLSPWGGIWTGTFTPKEAGTLAIEATDADEHFQQRAPLGDVLDSDPATRARASSRDQFPWDGYEPGPDENHSFRVAAPTAACDFDAEKNRFGTWTGTYELNSAGKGFDLRIGGKIWYEDVVSETAAVRFRSRLFPAGECHELTRMEFGPGSGSYTRTKTSKTLVRSVDIQPGTSPRVTTSDTPDEETTVTSGASTVDGRIDFQAGTYSASLSGEGSGGEHAPGFNDSGRFEGCAIPTLQGGESAESGSPDGEFWSKRDWTYSFSYAGPAQPEHAVMCPACFQFGTTQMAMQAYVQRASNLLQQASTSLFQSMRIDEGTSVANMISELEDLSSLFDANLEIEVASACDRASRAWVEEDPGYGAAVQEVQTRSREAEAQERDFALRAMQWTQRAAASLERSLPQAAAALKTLAQILGNRGWAAFGG